MKPPKTNSNPANSADAEECSRRLLALKEKILSIWERRVRDQLLAARREDKPTLRDHLPDFLENLARALSPQHAELDSKREENERIATQHGNQRAEKTDYSLEQVVYEYRTLRVTILEELEADVEVSLDVRKVIHEYLDDAILKATAAFVEFQRERDEASQRVAEEINQELRNTEEELQNALNQRDEFLSVATHELKTPLTGLLLQLQLLDKILVKRQDVGITVDEVKSRLSPSIRHVLKLIEMVDRLMDLSRVRSHRFLLELGVADLCQILTESVARSRANAESSGCEILHEECTSIPAYVDGLRLEQVLMNLLANASKYGAGKPIHVSLRSDENSAEFEVKDEGIGIAPEHLPKIFDRFHRGTTQRARDSLGLGLYITHQIVKAHGGEIQVESELGKGSTFRVRIPLRTMEENYQR